MNSAQIAPARSSMAKCLVFALLLLMLAVAGAQPATSGWPLARGNAQNTAKGMGAYATQVKKWSMAIQTYSDFPALVGKDGTIYMYGKRSGTFPGLYALNPNDGSVKWYQPGAGEFGFSLSDDGTIYCPYLFSPTFGNLLLYYLQAFDQATGKYKWMSPTVSSSFFTIGTDGNLFSDRGCYDRKTGAPVWTVSANSTSLPGFTSDGFVIYTDQSGKCSCLDNTTGKVIWSTNISNSYLNDPVIGNDGNIYVSGQDGYVYALNPATGGLLWSFKTDGGIGNQLAVGPNGDIAFCGWKSSTLGVFNIDAKTGSQKWFVASGKATDAIVDSAGIVYAGGLAIDGATGTTLNSIELGNYSMANDGSLVVKGQNSLTVYQSIHPISIILQPSNLIGSNPSTATVNLNMPAPAGGMKIPLWTDSKSDSVPLTLSIPAGQISATFQVSTFPVNFITNANIFAGFGTAVSAPLTILPSTPAALSFSPTTVLSGGTSTGTVTLTGPAGTGGVVVTLSSDSPSVSVPLSLTISAGQTSGTFTATGNGVDSATTANVTATLAGQSTSGALTVTPCGLSNLTLNPTSVVGGNSSIGTVTLSGPAGPSGLVVSLSSSPSSAIVPATVTVASGKSSATFTVSTTGVSSTTNATITASASGITTTALLTITDAVITNVVLNPSSVVGGNSSTGTINLSGQAGPGGVVVNLQSGNSFAMIPATVTITKGSNSGTFSITTLGVASQTSATITASYGGLTPSAVLTITPATIQSLVLNPTSVVGGNPSTGTVTLTGQAPPGGLSVSLTSSNLAATVPSSLTFPQGSSAGAFNISTSNVSLATTSNITATLGSSSQKATLSLTPTKLSSVLVNPNTVPGGSNTSGTVTLTGAAGAAGFMVILSSSSPSVASVPSSVTVPSGSFSASFSVTTTGVNAATNVTITATLNGVSQTCILTVNPAAIASVSMNPNSVVGGNNSNGTVNLTGPSGANGLLVNLSCSNGYTSVPSTVFIPGGQASATFTAKTIPVDSVQTSSISASASGVTQAATLTVNPPTLQSLNLNPPSVQGGTSSLATVTLSGPAGPSGLSYSVMSSSTSAAVPTTLTVAAGQSTATFTVTTIGVNAQTSASISVGSQVSASLTITPATVSGLSLNPSTMAGGLASTGTATLSGPAGLGGTSVTLSSNTNSAVVPSSVLVLAGQTSGTFTVNTSAVSSVTQATLTASLNSQTQTAVLTLSPVGLSSLSFNPSTVIGPTTSTGTVSLNAPAPSGGTVVTLSSKSTTVTVPASVTILAGQTSVNFTAKAIGVALPTTATVTASSHGVTVSSILTVNPPAISGLSLNPTSLTGGKSSTGTVTISPAAPAGGVKVILASNSSAAKPPASVVILAGKTSATFTVTTVKVSSQTTATVTATLGPTFKTAKLTIN